MRHSQPRREARQRPLGLGSTEGLGAVSEARYLASEQRPRDGGPRFRVSDGGRTISDEDFIFDALIRVVAEIAAMQQEGV